MVEGITNRVMVRTTDDIEEEKVAYPDDDYCNQILQMVRQREATRLMQKEEERASMAEHDEFRKKTEALLQSAEDTVDRYAQIKAKASLNCDIAAMQLARQVGLSSAQTKAFKENIQKESALNSKQKLG